MSVNGTLPRNRKQLSDQIDRLDLILTGLAEAIPGAVADALRESLPEVVSRAVKEALAHSPRSTTPESPRQESPNRLKRWWAECRLVLLEAIGRGNEWVGRRYHQIRRWFSRIAIGWAIVRLLTSQFTRSHRTSTLPVLVGVGGGVVGYLLGPVLESVVLGLLISALAFVGSLLKPWFGLVMWNLDHK